MAKLVGWRRDVDTPGSRELVIGNWNSTFYLDQATQDGHTNWENLDGHWGCVFLTGAAVYHNPSTAMSSVIAEYSSIVSRINIFEINSFNETICSISGSRFSLQMGQVIIESRR